MQKEFVTERLKLIDLYPDKAKSVAKEYGLKEDEVELIKKGVTSVKVETDKDERAVISFINTEDVDRDNEIIDPDGAILKYYNRVVPYGHDYRGLPMGKSMWIKKDKKNGKKGLLAKTIFLERPAINEELYHMYTDDIAGTGPVLTGWSIGFIPLEWEDYEEKKSSPLNKRDTNVKRKYTKWELLEYSGVMIGSNRQALTLMVKKGLIKDDKLKKDIEDFIEEEKIQRGIKLNKELDEEYDDFTYGVKKTQYKCTCIKCGWEHTSDKHCNTYKCEKCGGTMRRSSRPGPGQESETEENESAKEVILKPEETDDFIRIPVRDCKVTATITISAKEGITALYCGKIKKIRTYIFNKKEPYKWTLKKALAWVKEHGKSVDAAVEAFAIDLPEEDIDNVTDFIESYLKKEAEKELTEEKEPETEDPIKWIKELTEEVKALKEGRVLSGKNLKLVKDCKEQIDLVGELLDKLIVASEPPKEESILPLIEDNLKANSSNNDNKIDSLTKDDVPVIVEEVLNGLSKAISGQHKEIQKIFDKSRGKVN